jgi:hypothetical protein
MKKRKSINVAELTTHVNYVLKHGTGSKEERLGYMAVLEHCLFESGNYRGYRYLPVSEVPAGQKAGIHWNDLTANFDDTDETRREYS